MKFEELSNIGKHLLEHQLAWGNSGNISARLNESSMVITASGTNMGCLTTKDWVAVDLFSRKAEGSQRPSKEVPMHIGIYSSRVDANVVIHASPFWSTLAACSNMKIDSQLFIESMYYLEKVSYVDYYHPGSQALGEAVEKKAQEANVLMLKNHGVIVFDESIKEAIMRLETLEYTCKMMITAASADINLNTLEGRVTKEFLENGSYKPRKHA